MHVVQMDNAATPGAMVGNNAILWIQSFARLHGVNPCIAGLVSTAADMPPHIMHDA
jgi:hypothetical protein